MTIQEYSQQDSHVDKILGETYNLVRNIGLAFYYMDKDMMKKLISTVIRPRLERQARSGLQVIGRQTLISYDIT